MIAFGPAGVVVGVLGVGAVGLLPEHPGMLKALQVTRGLGIRLALLWGTVLLVMMMLLALVTVNVSWWIGERSIFGVRGEGGREEQHEEDWEVGESRRGEWVGGKGSSLRRSIRGAFEEEGEGELVVIMGASACRLLYCLYWEYFSEVGDEEHGG